MHQLLGRLLLLRFLFPITVDRFHFVFRSFLRNHRLLRLHLSLLQRHETIQFSSISEILRRALSVDSTIKDADDVIRRR